MPLTLMLKLATGRISSSPFDPGVVDEMTDVIARLLGRGEDRKLVDERQAFRPPWIADLLRSLGDPVWSLFKQQREGVPLGVNCEFQRTPEVFEEKLTWALDEMSDPLEKEATDYRSVEGYEDQIRQLSEEEAADKRKPSSGRTSKLQRSQLCLKPEKIWVVHDGTNKIHINNCIRVRDRVRSPTAGELRALMREKYEKKNRCKQFILVEDVSKAHGRVKVRQDWAFQACRLEPGSIWLNAVGTYGASSAGYWWSKLSSALLVRLFHYILSPAGDQDAPLYADDIFCTAGNKQEI